jgi:AcrR family transcriptional regulator
MRRPPPELARRLLDASEQVLRPDQEPRLEDVAAMVGSSRATLYYYFAGRDDLVAFLLEEHMATTAAAIAAAARDQQTPGDRLRSVAAALVEFLGERPGVCAGLLSFAGAAGRMQALMTAKDTVLGAPLEQVLADGAATGAFPIADPRDAANAMLGAVMIATLGRWYRGDGITPAFRQALTDQIVRGAWSD